MLKADRNFVIEEYKKVYNMSVMAVEDLSERYGKTKGKKAREALLSRFISWQASLMGAATALFRIDKSFDYEEDYARIIHICEKNMSS